MTQTYELFTVRADRKTGEWIGEPVSSGWAIDADEWNAKRNTSADDFGTFERDGVTCAIHVVWTN